MATPLRVLILEDQPADAELMLYELRRVGFVPAWERVETEAEYLAHLDQSLDVILADYHLPQFDALRALRHVQECGLDVPFIIVSGNLGEEMAVQCVKQGATDYLLKDRLTRLGQAVEQALEQKRLRNARRQAEQSLRQAEEKYRGIFENAVEGIFQTTPAGRFITVNPALVRMLGYTSAPALLERLSDIGQQLYVQAFCWAELMRRMAACGAVSGFEAQLYRQDGSALWTSVNARAVYDASRELLYYEGTIEDITERKRAEEAQQMHQVVEGKLDVTGVAFAGSPAVVAGHNGRIAWGMTFVHQDAMDFHKETINPLNPGEYRFNDEWKPIEVRPETFRVKGGKTVVREIRSTHRGPIISGEKDFGKGEAVSMRWLGMDDSNEMRAVTKLNRAGNWDEFRDAARDLVAVGVNVVYGDVEGNIGIYTCAGVPIRAKGDGLAVVPGETDEYDWKGLVPFERLPHTYNPPDGAVSSANNMPADESYPYLIGHSFDANRIQCIRRMLGEKTKFSVEDFARMQADVKSTRAERLSALILPELLRITDLAPEEKAALDLLKGWDYRYTADGAAPLIFERLYQRLARDVAGDELGPDLEDGFMNVASGYFMPAILERPDSAWWDDVRTLDKRESASEILRRSFGAAVASLESDFGSDSPSWSWGNAHSLTLKHPMSQVRIIDRVFRLNRGPFRLRGNFDTLNAFSYPRSRPFRVTGGPSQRHIFDTADWNRSLSVLPTGECGVPASPHYSDQMKLYLEDKYHSDLVDRALIEKAAKYRMRIAKAD